MMKHQPTLFDNAIGTPPPEPTASTRREVRWSELRGWPRAKALGDIGRSLAAAFNDGGQVNILVYDWQRELLVDELQKIEQIGSYRLTEIVLGSPANGETA